MFENPKRGRQARNFTTMFRKFYISNRLPHRYFLKIYVGCPWVLAVNLIPLKIQVCRKPCICLSFNFCPNRYSTKNLGWVPLDILDVHCTDRVTVAAYRCVEVDNYTVNCKRCLISTFETSAVGAPSLSRLHLQCNCSIFRCLCTYLWLLFWRSCLRCALKLRGLHTYKHTYINFIYPRILV